MKEARLTLSEGFRRMLEYPRFHGPTRMLILHTNYFFDAAWERAARQLGWEVATVKSAMAGTIGRQEIADLFTAVGAFKPHFVLTSNYAGMDLEGLFARFFEDARIPYVSWFTDTPRMILYDRTIHASHYSVAVTWERAYEPHFRALGFPHVFFMPHAADPAVFNLPPAAAWQRDLAFVGISMIDLSWEAWQKLDEAVPEVAAAIREAFSSGRVTRESFADGVETILEPALLATCSVRDRRHVELCIIYEATKRARCSMVERLVPHGIHVHGDPEWRSITPMAFGEIGYFDDLPAFYQSTAVNLNSTSVQMRTSVNQRVLDCPAAGGFLLTDAQGDLDEFFEPGTECVTYACLEDLEDKVHYYLAHPSERTDVVRRAQRRIAAHHTHAHRLASLEAFLRERYSS